MAIERTPEQIAADEELAAAIEKVVKLYDLLPEDAIVLDYVVTIEGMRVDDDRTFFAAAYKNGYCRQTVAIGLLLSNLRELMSSDE